MQSTDLNLLDAAFLNIERREDPWSIHLELEFERRIDEERLREAFLYALQRHPMARARLRRYSAVALRYHWDIADSPDELPLRVVEPRGEAELSDARDALLSEAIPMDSSPLLRLLLLRDTPGDRLLINVSHVVADGLSAMRLLNSIIRHYAGEEDPVPGLDPLGVRDLSSLVAARSLRERMERLSLFAQYLGKSATPPVRVAPGEGAAAPTQGYGVTTLVLDGEESARVAEKRRRPATVNDLLIAALAMAIRRWNTEHGGSEGKISVMMPVNLRPESWWYEVVGNYSSYVNVILSRDQQHDLATACLATSGQTLRFKEAGAAGTLIDVLSVPRFLPAVLKAQLRQLAPGIGRAHVQTTWLSNLGRLASPPTMGDAGAVRSICFSPPAPMPMGLSLGAVSLEDRMMLTLRYNRQILDAEGASRFADLLRSTLLL